jgi:hypothetical protein
MTSTIYFNEVSRCMHSVTILACLPGFDFREIKEDPTGTAMLIGWQPWKKKIIAI